MTAKTLMLYSTLGCHLCEEAKALLWPLLTEFGWQLREVDIAASDQLVERYGTRIPVLVWEGGGRQDARRELGWPFDETELRALLQVPV